MIEFVMFCFEFEKSFKSACFLPQGPSVTKMQFLNGYDEYDFDSHSSNDSNTETKSGA